MMNRKYTIKEVKEWLEGWFLVDGDGNIKGESSLQTIINMLEDDQDGINIWLLRKKYYETRPQ